MKVASSGVSKWRVLPLSGVKWRRQNGVLHMFNMGGVKWRRVACFTVKWRVLPLSGVKWRQVAYATYGGVFYTDP